MQSRKTPINPDLVYFDPFKINRAMVDAKLSQTQLASNADVALNTVREAVGGNKGLARFTAGLIAETLGHKVTELLAPWDHWYRPPADPLGPWVGTAEWEVQGYLNQGRLAPNGLYYIVCRMQHRHTPSKQGRGKFYHLSWLTVAAREALQADLVKHAEVCARVGAHPQISMNLSSTPVAGNEGWWVVDEWVGAETLADRLSHGPVPAEQVPRLLHDIAQGLAAMHAANVVFRELAPAKVLIAEKDGRAVLTDFELARLLDGVSSGGRDWPEDDPYLAPEIDSGNATVKSDLYSFGKMAVAAIAGMMPKPDRVPVVLGAAGVSKKFQRMLLDCLEPLPSRRPPDVATLLPYLAAWQKGKR